METLPRRRSPTELVARSSRSSAGKSLRRRKRGRDSMSCFLWTLQSTSRYSPHTQMLKKANVRLRSQLVTYPGLHAPCFDT